MRPEDDGLRREHDRGDAGNLTLASVLAVSLALILLFASLLSAVNGDQLTEWQRSPIILGVTAGIGLALLLAGFVGIGLAERRRRGLGTGTQMSGEPLLSAEARDLAPAQRDGLAVASLVLGILGVYVITAIAALVFGFMAKQEIDRSGGQLVGRRMAIAGSILGGVWLGLFLFFVWAVASGLVS